MSMLIPPNSPPPGNGGPNGVVPPGDDGDRGPLRHFLIGSPQRLRATIRHLQVLRYVEHSRWTHLLHIDRDQGLIIRPTVQEMYTYLELPQWRD